MRSSADHVHSGRPGTFALVIDCATGGVLHQPALPAGHQFNGHGAPSQDDGRLMTSEVVAEGSAGRIGLWAVGRRSRRTGAAAWPLDARSCAGFLPATHGRRVRQGGIRRLDRRRQWHHCVDLRPVGSAMLFVTMAAHRASFGRADISGVAANGSEFMAYDGQGAVWALAPGPGTADPAA